MHQSGPVDSGVEFSEEFDYFSDDSQVFGIAREQSESSVGDRRNIHSVKFKTKVIHQTLIFCPYLNVWFLVCPS
jgi:hypothetical protein